MRGSQPSLILTLALTLSLTVHCALVEDIRDRIVQDLGLSRTPDTLHVSQTPLGLPRSQSQILLEP